MNKKNEQVSKYCNIDTKSLQLIESMAVLSDTLLRYYRNKSGQEVKPFEDNAIREIWTDNEMELFFYNEVQEKLAQVESCIKQVQHLFR